MLRAIWTYIRALVLLPVNVARLLEKLDRWERGTPPHRQRLLSTECVRCGRRVNSWSHLPEGHVCPACARGN